MTGPASLSGDEVVELTTLALMGPVYAGEGGSSGLFRAIDLREPGRPALIYKDYRPETIHRLDRDALSRLVATRALLDPSAKRHCALPIDVVTHGGEPRGFLMPEAPRTYLWLDGTGRPAERGATGFRMPRTGEELCRTREVTKDGIVRRTYSTDHQLNALGHLLALILALHRAGIVLGDIQPRNFLLGHRRMPARVFLVDCDSFLVEGVSTLPSREPEAWKVPARPGRHDRATDLAKFALLTQRALQRNWGEEPDLDSLRGMVPTAHADVLSRLWECARVPDDELVRLVRWLRWAEIGKPRTWVSAMRGLDASGMRAALSIAGEPPGLEGYRYVVPDRPLMVSAQHARPPSVKFRRPPRRRWSGWLFGAFACYAGVLGLLGLLGIIQLH